MPAVVNLARVLESFDDRWSPRIVGELNGQHVKLAKVEGEFVWHHHEDEDELFLVLSGRLRLELRDETVELGPGEMCVVPRRVEHRPVAEVETHLLLFEPADTRNTGNVENETSTTGERIPMSDDDSGDARLVQVWATADGGLLALVKSLLESADIPFVVQGEEALGLFPVGPVGSGGPVRRVMAARIHVPEDRAEEARTLLESTAEVPGDLPEGADTDGDTNG